ncbi:MAG: YvcK family protein [Chloroflexi bacterium]|nr:YvcK family protein [Chloroflexota bacterium]
MWRVRRVIRWMRPGFYIKRWLVLILLGMGSLALAFAQLVIVIHDEWPRAVDAFVYDTLVGPAVTIGFLLLVGIGLIAFGAYRLNKSLMAPLHSPGSLREWVRMVRAYQQLRQGIRVVAIGGGTGMPSALRAMKSVTSNITAVVTMADDGGSSGRLRRDLGVQPPGDLRNNITALARDEDLMTQLFHFRFTSGELADHSFGNLFLAALVGMMGSMDHAAAVAGRVLAIQGRVLPCTLDDVNLVAEVRHRQSGEQLTIKGESNIPKSEWTIEHVFLEPSGVKAFPEVVAAIQDAQLIVIGPGSLYTSILPNLIVDEVAEAIRASAALTVYVCNIATQPGETDDYTVADHIMAIEQHVGVDIVDVVVANNHYPVANAGPNTIYVPPVPGNHAIRHRYRFVYADLTDNQRPWRHDHEKLRQVLLSLRSDSFHRNAQRTHAGKTPVLR